VSKKDVAEYLPPFHAPRLNKWVLMERDVAANARAGGTKIHLYLFDDQATAQKFYLVCGGAAGSAGKMQLH
jgi:hypothetical protein